MKQPTISEIDQIRNAGFRPQIVGCFLNDKKILFLFKNEHALWQFPQGGIDNNETVEVAFFREMAEELGEEFISSCDKNILMIGEDKVEFPQNTQNSHDLKNDAGQNIFMKGKKYFFVCTKITNKNIDIAKTEFDDFRWMTFNEAKDLCNEIYQQGKKRITIKALNLLKEIYLL